LNNEITKNAAQVMLKQEMSALIRTLLKKYTRHDIATYCGIYLRFFGSSEKLVHGWQDLDHLNELSDLVLNTDFNVQSDALETM